MRLNDWTSKRLENEPEMAAARMTNRQRMNRGRRVLGGLERMAGLSSLFLLMLVLFAAARAHSVDELSGDGTFATTRNKIGRLTAAGDPAGSYSGSISQTKSSCQNPADNGTFSQALSLVLNEPTTNASTTTITGTINDGSHNTDISATLSTSGNVTTFSSGVFVDQRGAGHGSGTFSGQLTFGQNGQNDQLTVNFQGTDGADSSSQCTFSGTFTAARTSKPAVLVQLNDNQTLTTTAPDTNVIITNLDGGRKISPLANTGGSHYNGSVALQPDDFTDANAGVQVAQTAGGSADTIFGFGSDANNWFRFVVEGPGGPNSVASTGAPNVEFKSHVEDTSGGQKLILQKKSGGSVTNLLSINYDPVNHLFWRYRQNPANNTISYETSPDGLTWTVLLTVPLLSAASLSAEINAGTAVPVQSPGTATFGSVLKGGNQPGNPIDGVNVIVAQQYFDFLSRPADSAGFSYWTNSINQCGSDALCIRERRIAVADAFFFEPEFQESGAYIYRIYKAALGTRLSYAQFNTDRAQVVGGSALDASKTAFATAFVQRSDFTAKFPTLDASNFVDNFLMALKDNTGVDLTPQRSAFINTYNTGSTQAESRGLVVRQATDTQSVIDAVYNETFVVVEYFGYLRRDPDAGGQAFWLGKVNAAPLRNTDIQHAMVCSFITSTEYQYRFGSVATRSNGECPQ